MIYDSRLITTYAVSHTDTDGSSPGAHVLL